MKKLTAVSVPLCIVLLLFAAGCSKQSGPTDLDVKAAAAAVIASGAYTDDMSLPADPSMALSQYKIDAADVSDYCVYFSSMATAEECAVFKAANADFQIGTARTEHLRNVNAPGYRQIAADPILRGFKHQMLPGLRRHSPADPYRLAVQHCFTGGTGQRKPAVTFKLNIHLAERNLQRGGIRRVADQQVGNHQRGFIQRTAETDPRLSLSLTSAILYRRVHSGADHLQHTPSFCGTKRTRSPERSSTGS